MIYEIPKGSWVRLDLVGTYQIEADSLQQAKVAAIDFVCAKGEVTCIDIEVKEKKA